MPTHKIYCYIY